MADIRDYLKETDELLKQLDIGGGGSGSGSGSIFDLTVGVATTGTGVNEFTYSFLVSQLQQICDSQPLAIRLVPAPGSAEIVPADNWPHTILYMAGMDDGISVYQALGNVSVTMDLIKFDYGQDYVNMHVRYDGEVFDTVSSEIDGIWYLAFDVENSEAPK